MAEHGRNLVTDPRASLAVNDPSAPGDPLDRPRITLAGRCVQPQGDAAEAALRRPRRRDSRRAAIAGWDDFSVWVLEVRRVRWVGGFARMDTVSPEEYRAAVPDPTQPIAAKAVEHLNKSHAEGLLAIARELAGARGAVSAVCTGIDRYGIDLSCTGAGQAAAARVEVDEPLVKAADVRPATVELAARAGGAAGRQLSLNPPRIGGSGQPAGASPGGKAPAGTLPGKSPNNCGFAERGGGSSVEHHAGVADRHQQAQRGGDLQVGGVGLLGARTRPRSSRRRGRGGRAGRAGRRAPRRRTRRAAAARCAIAQRRDEPRSSGPAAAAAASPAVARDRAGPAAQRPPHDAPRERLQDLVAPVLGSQHRRRRWIGRRQQRGLGHELLELAGSRASPRSSRRRRTWTAAPCRAEEQALGGGVRRRRQLDGLVRSIPLSSSARSTSRTDATRGRRRAWRPCGEHTIARMLLVVDVGNTQTHFGTFGATSSSSTGASRRCASRPPTSSARPAQPARAARHRPRRPRVRRSSRPRSRRSRPSGWRWPSATSATRCSASARAEDRDGAALRQPARDRCRPARQRRRRRRSARRGLRLRRLRHGGQLRRVGAAASTSAASSRRASRSRSRRSHARREAAADRPRCRRARVIGKSTVDAIRSGVIYGFAGAVDGIVRRAARRAGGGHRRDRHRRAGRAIVPYTEPSTRSTTC